MLDHLSLKVSDVEKSKSFYQALLLPLGYHIQMDFGKAVSFHEPNGTNSGGDFWIVEGEPSPMHLAFTASTKEEVEAFYQAGLSAGGQANGAPAIREHYHPNYYAAYIYDPDGHNIEAVCHVNHP